MVTNFVQTTPTYWAWAWGEPCVQLSTCVHTFYTLIIAIIQTTSSKYQRRAPPTVPRPFPFPSTPSPSHPHPHTLVASPHHSMLAPYYQTSAVPRPQPPYPCLWEAPTCNSHSPITKLLQSIPQLLPLLKLLHHP